MWFVWFDIQKLVFGLVWFDTQKLVVRLVWFDIQKLVFVIGLLKFAAFLFLFESTMWLRYFSGEIN